MTRGHREGIGGCPGELGKCREPAAGTDVAGTPYDCGVLCPRRRLPSLTLTRDLLFSSLGR
ncbi:hypothetical protein GCM10014715_40870 [Streptomyces spiralis]|uniref:Uncharacterized protein n=1 Tax=Streptomyces spiralis TaxID=66376 RepID=A0A919A0L6_9ACTN|nr:hypothetical protein GCM10014715_40870 [Streptomyces spiralis]